MRTAGLGYQNGTKRGRGPPKRKLHKGVLFHTAGRKGAEKQPIVKIRAAEMHHTSISVAHYSFFSRTKPDFLAEKGGTLAAKAEIACRKAIRQRAEERKKTGHKTAFSVSLGTFRGQGPADFLHAVPPFRLTHGHKASARHDLRPRQDGSKGREYASSCISATARHSRFPSRVPPRSRRRDSRSPDAVKMTMPL